VRCAAFIDVFRAALRELVGEAEYFLGILPDGSGIAACD
jgi:hypothetical protein